MQLNWWSKLRSLLSVEMAIDLGTTNTRIYMKDRGIVLNEPSVIATTIQDGQTSVVAVGEEAKQMIGRTPDTIQAKHPLQKGVIADSDLVTKMLTAFIKSAQYPKKFVSISPDILMCVPAGATNVDQRSFQGSTESAGVRRVSLLRQPLAAALGAGLNIKQAQASMIVDIGGGKTEVAVISLNGMTSVQSIPVGGYMMNQAIRNFIRKDKNLDIGENTAEWIKIQIGSAPLDNKITPEEEETLTIKGRDIAISTIPIEVKINSSQVQESLSEPVHQIIQTVEKALSAIGSELYLDLCNTGMFLIGGGSMLKNMEKALAEKTHLAVFRAEHPLECVALGAGQILENIEKYQDIIE